MGKIDTDIRTSVTKHSPPIINTLSFTNLRCGRTDNLYGWGKIGLT